jgi:hypothetical protein
VGRFLSQDLAHLSVGDASFQQRFSRKLAQHLADPQQLNSYSYARNNPLVYIDTNGEYGRLAILGAGGLANAGALGISDIVRGEMSSWHRYTGQFIGGAAGTEAFLQTQNMYVAGGVTGGVSELASQALERQFGNREGFDGVAIGVEIGRGFAFSKAGELVPIPGLTRGRGSFTAVTRQIETKLINGQIRNIAPTTFAKAATVYAINAAPQAIFNGVTGGLTPSLSNISASLSAISSLVEGIKKQVESLRSAQ